MGGSLEGNGASEPEPGEKDNILWVMVLTPLILSGALTVAAFLFGPAFDATPLMADWTVNEPLHLPGHGSDASYEGVVNCRHDASESPWWEGHGAMELRIGEVNLALADAQYSAEESEYAW